mmetsp:Transcript_118073/g.345828  ORF Transcript_118073/g.345828 Transcript_118073/m.345828 type:complete len:202 (-) Transcript_118073:924-1529(-)
MCDGKVPAPPPTKFNSPALARSRMLVAYCSGSFPAALGQALHQPRCIEARAWQGPCSSSGPIVEPTPKARGLVCLMLMQKASADWPEGVRPPAAIWALITRGGRLLPSREKCSSIAKIAAFAFRQSVMPSSIKMSTPPSAKPLICSSYASTIVFQVTLGVSDNMQVVGPSRPATRRGFAGSCFVTSAAAFFASWAAALFIS